MKTLLKKTDTPQIQIQKLELHKNRLYNAIDKLELLSDETLQKHADTHSRLDFVRSWKVVIYSAPRTTDIILTNVLIKKGKESCKISLTKELEMTEKNISTLKQKR